MRREIEGPVVRQLREELEACQSKIKELSSNYARDMQELDKRYAHVYKRIDDKKNDKVMTLEEFLKIEEKRGVTCVRELRHEQRTPEGIRKTE